MRTQEIIGYILIVAFIALWIYLIFKDPGKVTPYEGLIKETYSCSDYFEPNTKFGEYKDCEVIVYK